jgi:predicted CXXCH cytochrome family protein
VLTNTEGAPQELSVAPVKVAAVWHPKARFDHGAHEDVVCADCHAAAESVESSDVLLPKIAVCRDCHGGETVSDRVPSPCVTCHAFHLDGMPPMHPARETAAQ